jgi:hypothetical protein
VLATFDDSSNGPFADFGCEQSYTNADAQLDVIDSAIDAVFS